MSTTLHVPTAPVRQAGTPGVMVFDSGLGGLTVFDAIARLRPAADYLYAADDAVFPYGELGAEALLNRVLSLMGPWIAWHRPDVVVVACNTASTLVLGPLRERWPDLAFVGTVPAIKPAAAASRTRRIGVLATPATVTRDYTRGLVRSFAGDCAVDLVGAPRLASLAEAWLRGEALDDAAVEREIAPAFIDRDRRRTDAIVLACTHYPLLRHVFERVAPWPVAFVDPAPAIARRTEAVLVGRGFRAADPEAPPLPRRALFTSGAASGSALRSVLARRGLDPTTL